jgi:sensor histidine kinase YesM
LSSVVFVELCRSRFLSSPKSTDTEILEENPKKQRTTTQELRQELNNSHEEYNTLLEKYQQQQKKIYDLKRNLEENRRKRTEREITESNEVIWAYYPRQRYLSPL